MQLPYVGIAVQLSRILLLAQVLSNLFQLRSSSQSYVLKLYRQLFRGLFNKLRLLEEEYRPACLNNSKRSFTKSFREL